MESANVERWAMARKIVDLDPIEIANLVDALVERYDHVLEDEKFEIRSDGDEEGVQLHCRLAKLDRSWAFNLEVRAQIQDFSGRAEASRAAVDVEGYVLDCFFQGDRSLRPPLDWQVLKYGGDTLYFRGTIRNETLEDAADALLLQDGFKFDNEES